jgi:hypothetical protein
MSGKKLFWQRIFLSDEKNSTNIDSNTIPINNSQRFVHKPVDNSGFLKNGTQLSNLFFQPTQHP